MDSLVAPRFWCRSFCPGGALYTLLGKFRIIHIKRDEKACTLCTDCNVICPMALKPMTDKTGLECDSCGLCIDVCGDRALKYQLKIIPEKKATEGKTENIYRKQKILITLLFLIFGFPMITRVVYAHHIMGIPHYSYDENYPQAPVLKLVEIVGDWKIQLTGYPGQPKPWGTYRNAYLHLR